MRGLAPTAWIKDGVLPEDLCVEFAVLAAHGGRAPRREVVHPCGEGQGGMLRQAVTKWFARLGFEPR